MRLTSDELNKIYDEKGIKHNDLWSYSKYDSYKTSPYLFFLRYVSKVVPQEDRISAYAPMGTSAHDILEHLYTDQPDMDNEKMVAKYTEDWEYNINILGERFDREDDNKNASIAKRYKENMSLFFADYKKVPYKVYCEKHIVIEVAKGIVFHGYIDAMYKDENNNLIITDYKSSTIYRGDNLIKHSYQLVLYAEGMRQLGVPKNKIRCCFNFLKYVNYKYLKNDGKNFSAGSIVERCTLGQKLKPKVIYWAQKLGYNEKQINKFAIECEAYNSIDKLPEDLKSKFSIECARVFIDNPFEVYEKVKQELIEQIPIINNKITEYKNTKNDHIFWDDDENLSKQSYFFTCLMDYKISQHKPYAEYLKRKEIEQKENDDLFGVTKEDAKVGEAWAFGLFD